jgi:uncharacterized protein (TIGR02145 family)
MKTEKKYGKMEQRNRFNKFFWLFVAINTSVVVLNSCDSRKSLTTDKGVIINGVKWATRNVDKPGTFAKNPEDAGMFYQWNRKIGWSATDPMLNSDGDTKWNATRSEGAEWEKTNDPCPCGWRVPTYKEIFDLLFTATASNSITPHKVSIEWVTVKGITGSKFTDKVTGKYIFLPAAGGRDGGDSGKIISQGEYGFYWSSTLAEIHREHEILKELPFAYYFIFGSEGQNIINLIPRSGFSLRCVAE